MTETNVPVVSNNAEDYVDISSSNVDSHGEHGTHSDFSKQQASDSQYNTLTEADTAGGHSESWVSPTGYSDPSSVWNSETNAYDENTGTMADCAVPSKSWSGYLQLSFSSTTGTKLRYFFGRQSTNINWTQIDAYTSSWESVYSGAPSVDAWTNVTFTSKTATQIRFRFYNTHSSQARNAYVYEADYLNDAVAYNYELDLEGQWTSADYDENTEYICIRTGTLNAELLKVDVWDTSGTPHWDNVIASLSASTWNNVSVATWLTGSTFTMRFLGGTESGDTTQSTWQIDAVLLHTYTVSDNYGLDLEEQFTDAEYSRTYEDLCIFAGATDAEDIKVYVWYASSWTLLISDLTANSWNNVSVTSYLTASTFTIKFLDGTTSSDGTQNNWKIDCTLLHTYPVGYNLNLRVRDWDLTDNIQGAIVYKDTDTKTSDSDGWANWTLVSGTVLIKVKYFGFWVNGTFSVNVDSDKTITIKCKLHDVTVTVQEGEQSAYLVSANVTVYNATSTSGNKIKTGVTGSNGQVSFTNLPNNTLTFTQYGDSSYTTVIGNTTQSVSSDGQSIVLTANMNAVSTTSSYRIIAFVASVIPMNKKFIGLKKRNERNEKGVRGDKNGNKKAI